MSNKVIPFQFSSSIVRTIDDNGEPLFVAKDVATILGYSNTSSAISRHCKGVVKRDILTSGGMQLMSMVHERDVYRLVMNSRLPEAEKFEEWVVGEVLPAIRKTGSYAIEQMNEQPRLSNPLKDTVDAIQSIGTWLSQNVVGINPGMAAAATLATISKETGISTDAFRLALPSIAPEKVGQLNATKVGNELGINAQAANMLLEKLGLQIKNNRSEWELTSKGTQHGEMIPYNRKGHSGYQVLWNTSVIDFARRNKSF